MFFMGCQIVQFFRMIEVGILYDLALLCPATALALAAARRSSLSRLQLLAIVLAPLLLEASLLALFAQVPAGYTRPERATARLVLLALAARIARPRRALPDSPSP